MRSEDTFLHASITCCCIASGVNLSGYIILNLVKTTWPTPGDLLGECPLKRELNKKGITEPGRCLLSIFINICTFNCKYLNIELDKPGRFSLDFPAPPPKPGKNALGTRSGPETRMIKEEKTHNSSVLIYDKTVLQANFRFVLFCFVFSFTGDGKLLIHDGFGRFNRLTLKEWKINCFEKLKRKKDRLNN